MKNMLRLVLVLTTVFFAVSSSAYAARMPDIVKREFAIEGQSAIDIMNFLGFSLSHDGTYKLPWARRTAVCAKDDGTTGPCDPNPTIRCNTLTYKTGKQPKVLIAGVWFDGETGSFPDVPKYSFQSPPIDSPDLADWKIIINKHARELSPGNKSTEVMTDSAPLVRIESWEFEGRVTYSLGIDERSPKLRKIAEEEYKSCFEKLSKSGADGGC